MRLGTKGRYAVTAVVDLACNGASGTPASLAIIAERQGISPSYLEQLFMKLRRAKIVTSTRGAQGGYVLARPAHEIRIADIFRAVGEPVQATRCTKGSAVGCTMRGARCITHDLWANLDRVIEDYLETTTVADACKPAPLSLVSSNLTSLAIGEK